MTDDKEAHCPKCGAQADERFDCCEVFALVKNTDFSNHPLSIAEIKSDKTRNGSDWTPRDALISALRDIDSGAANPSDLLILTGRIDEHGATHTCYYNATANRYIMQGIIGDFLRRLAVKDAGGDF